MIPVPEVNDAEMIFGSIRYLPKREDLPIEYQRDWHSYDQPFCHAISMWFMKGAEIKDNKLISGGKTFVPKPGVDFNMAMRALKAILSSWEPKHERKIGGCGYLLSQWFDIEK